VGGERHREFEQVYRECLPHVRMYAAARVGRDEVDDVVNATFFTVWQRFDEAPPLSRRAWVLGVARNHCRNRWRTSRRFSALVDEIVKARPRLEIGLDDAGVAPETLAAFAAVIPQLTPRERELLVLTSWLELSPNEIAEMIDETPGSVRVRLHRLRATMVNRLGAHGVGGDDDDD
jgi:RNA polymerase sigma factor (sigma-70 family)